MYFSQIHKGLREVGKEGSNNMRNYYLETIFGAILNKNPKNKMQRASLIVDFKGLTYMQFASLEGIKEYLVIRQFSIFTYIYFFK